MSKYPSGNKIKKKNTARQELTRLSRITSLILPLTKRSWQRCFYSIIFKWRTLGKRFQVFSEHGTKDDWHTNHWSRPWSTDRNCKNNQRVARLLRY